MIESERQYNELVKNPANFNIDRRSYKAGWQGALRWYQAVANKCEKDCMTPEDYKVLYFHLKQVLENEVGRTK